MSTQLKGLIYEKKFINTESRQVKKSNSIVFVLTVFGLCVLPIAAAMCEDGITASGNSVLHSSSDLTFAQNSRKHENPTNGQIVLKNTDNDLLNDFIKSKGYHNSIVFDESNIKQFWISNSVAGKNDSINISLEKNKNQVFESNPFIIKLINVNETQDCKVEIITDKSNFSFNVLNSKLRPLAATTSEESFIEYQVLSNTFHLEDTFDYSFYLQFFSNALDNISIKKIIISFSENKNSKYLFSPGSLKISKNDITHSNSTMSNDSLFCVTGKRTQIFTKKNIIISNAPLKTSVKVTNMGKTSTNVHLGFATYQKTGENLQVRNYPYNVNDNILTVQSSEDGSKSIIVDQYPKWAKNCHLVLGAKEDFSDIPSFNFVEGTIEEVKRLDEDRAEIIMDRPLKKALPAGSKIRIHGAYSGQIYVKSLLLQPGEESTVSFEIKRDNDYMQYSTKALAKGVYYVKPVIFSYTTDESIDNCILISDYIVDF